MKSILLIILGIIIFHLLLPLLVGCLLIWLLVQLLCHPFRKAKYKKSHFYRDFGIKYRWEYYDTVWYELYNAIRTNALPIRSIPRYDDQGKLFEISFIYGGKLLETIMPEILYDQDNEAFAFDVVDDMDEVVKVSINQYSEEILSEWNEKAPEEDRCREVVYWVTDSNFVDQDELPIAKETTAFLFYDPKNITEALERFISGN